MNKFLNELSFWKFLITIGLCTGALWVKIDGHLNDARAHLNEIQSAQLYDIKEHGFTYSESEKIEIERRLTALEVKLQRFENEGRLQTPDEKVLLMKRALRELLAENGYHIIKER
jgi:hypothetical protein